MWRRLLGRVLPTTLTATPPSGPDHPPRLIPAWPPASPDLEALAAAAEHGLPAGLSSCPVCGHPRGQTPEGAVSACLCSGLRCRWCGEVRQRPISDYYDPDDATWWHVPFFTLSGHRCDPPPEEGTAVEPQWEDLEPAAEVAAYQRAVSDLAWRELDAREQARERFARGEDVPPAAMGFLYLAPGLEVRRRPQDGRPVVVRIGAPDGEDGGG